MPHLHRPDPPPEPFRLGRPTRLLVATRPRGGGALSGPNARSPDGGHVRRRPARPPASRRGGDSLPLRPAAGALVACAGAVLPRLASRLAAVLSDVRQTPLPFRAY